MANNTDRIHGVIALLQRMGMRPNDRQAQTFAQTLMSMDQNQFDTFSFIGNTYGKKLQSFDESAFANARAQYDYYKKRTEAGYDPIEIDDPTWNPTAYDDDTNEVLGMWYRQNKRMPTGYQRAEFENILGQYKIDKQTQNVKDSYLLAGYDSAGDTALNWNLDWKAMGFDYDPNNKNDTRRRQLNMPPASFLTQYSTDEEDSQRLQAGRLPKSLDPQYQQDVAMQQYMHDTDSTIRNALGDRQQAERQQEYQRQLDAYNQWETAYNQEIGKDSSIREAERQTREQPPNYTAPGNTFRGSTPTAFGAYKDASYINTTQNIKDALDDVVKGDPNSFGNSVRLGWLRGQLNFMRGIEAYKARSGLQNQTQEITELFNHPAFAKQVQKSALETLKTGDLGQLLGSTLEQMARYPEAVNRAFPFADSIRALGGDEASRDRLTQQRNYAVFNQMTAPLQVFGSILYEQAGAVYADMIDKGISQKNATTAAEVVAPVLAGLEYAEVGTLLGKVPGVSKATALLKGKIKNALVSKAVEFVARDVAAKGTEVFQELAQELMQITGEETAKQLDNTPGLKPATKQEVIDRLMQTADQTLKAVMLSTLGGSFNETRASGYPSRIPTNPAAQTESAQTAPAAPAVQAPQAQANFAPNMTEKRLATLKTQGLIDPAVTLADVQQGSLPQGVSIPSNSRTAAVLDTPGMTQERLDYLKTQGLLPTNTTLENVANGTLPTGERLNSQSAQAAGPEGRGMTQQRLGNLIEKRLLPAGTSLDDMAAGIQPSIPTRPGYVPGLRFATAPRSGSGASALPPAVQARRSIPTKGVPAAKEQLRRITPSIPTAPGARGRLPRAMAALATAGFGQSIPTNPVGRVAAPASTGPRAIETPQKLALDAAVANELARQAKQGYTQGEPDARRMPGEAALSHSTAGSEPTTAPKGQFSREALQAQRSFMDDLPGILKQFGMSMQQFHELRMRPAITLSKKERGVMRAIRDSVLAPTADTIMQKVIPIGDIANYLRDDSPWYQLKGYVARAADVKQLRTYRDLYESLRLDYLNDKGTYNYELSDGSCGVIRYRTPQYAKANKPYSYVMVMGSEKAYTANPPFTGNGFTAARNGQAVPEYVFDDPAKMDDGAELYMLSSNGTETLVAIYSKEVHRFVKVN